MLIKLKSMAPTSLFQVVAWVLLTISAGAAWAATVRPSNFDIDIWPPGDNAQLLLVQVAFRHGARSSLSTMYYPNASYSECNTTYKGVKLQRVDEFGPDPPPILDLDAEILPGGCRMGQLTQPGYNMAVKLGTWLRKRYIISTPFLNSTLQADAVWLRATGIDRTMKTLQGVVTGLWPDHSEATPVVVRASYVDSEYEYGKVQGCPNLQPLHTKLAEGLAARDKADLKLQALGTKVAAHLKLPVGSERNLSWVRLYDSLATQKALAHADWPEGASEGLFRLIEQQAVRQETPTVGPRVADGLLTDEECKKAVRLSIGPLLWRIVDNMASAQASQQHGVIPEARRLTQAQRLSARRTLRLKSATEVSTAASPLGMANAVPGSPVDRPVPGRTKLVLFSGHDSTVTPLLAVLQPEPPITWPPYTSSIVFELWGQPGVKGTHVRVLLDKMALDISQIAPGKSSKAARQGWITLTALQLVMDSFMSTDSEHTTECSAPTSL